MSRLSPSVRMQSPGRPTVLALWRDRTKPFRDRPGSRVDGADTSPGHQRKVVGLMDHMGAGNLGDDTTQTAVIQNIRRRWPDVDIRAFTMNPPDTEARHGIQAWPLRRRTWDRPGEAMRDAPYPADGNGGAGVSQPWRVPRWLAGKLRTGLDELGFLLRSYRAVRQVDRFVLSGSGQLLDSWGGVWEYPYTVCKWVLLAKLAGAKCYFLNVGAGPLDRKLSRFFVRQALRMADYAGFRDQPSLQLARRIGFSGHAEVSHDSVYCFDHARIGAQPSTPRAGAAVVGLAPMAWCDPRRYCVRDGEAYQRFLDKFAAFGSRLSQQHRVSVFSTDIWFDADTLAELADRIMAAPGTVRMNLLARPSVDAIDGLLDAMSTMDYVVTCRFHGVIFAHLLNIPVVAVSHHPKVTTLMADLGLSEYCLDIETFDTARLASAFDRMVADRARIKAGMAATAGRYRNELTAQFDRLFPME